MMQNKPSCQNCNYSTKRMKQPGIACGYLGVVLTDERGVCEYHKERIVEDLTLNLEDE